MTTTVARGAARTGGPRAAVAGAGQLRRPGLPLAAHPRRRSTIPVLLGFLVYELWIGSRLAIAKFGLDFVTTSTWDPVAEQFGAFPLDFRDPGLVAARAAHRGAALARRRDLPDRVRAQGGPPAGRVPDRAARRDPQRGLRPLGHLRPDPAPPHSVFPVPPRHFGFLPFFQGPIYGPSMLVRRASSSRSW